MHRPLLVSILFICEFLLAPLAHANLRCADVFSMEKTFPSSLTSDDWVEKLDVEASVVARQSIDELVEVLLTSADNTRFLEKNPYILSEFMDRYGFEVDLNQSTGLFIVKLTPDRAAEITPNRRIKIKYFEEIVRKALEQKERSDLLALFDLLFTDKDFLGDMSEKQRMELAKDQRVERSKKPRIIPQRANQIRGFWFKGKYYIKKNGRVEFTGFQRDPSIEDRRSKTNYDSTQLFWFKDPEYLDELRKKRETPIEYFLRRNGLPVD